MSSAAKKNTGFLPALFPKHKIPMPAADDHTPLSPHPPSSPKELSSSPRSENSGSTATSSPRAIPTSTNGSFYSSAASTAASAVHSPPHPSSSTMTPYPPPSTRRRSVVLRQRIFGTVNSNNISVNNSPRLPAISSLHLQRDSFVSDMIDIPAQLRQQPLPPQVDPAEEEEKRQKIKQGKMQRRMRRSIQRYVTENKINLNSNKDGIDPVETLTSMYTYTFGTHNDCFDEYDVEGKLPNYFIAQDAELYEEIFDVKKVQAKNLLALHYYANRVKKELKKIFE